MSSYPDPRPHPATPRTVLRVEDEVVTDLKMPVLDGSAEPWFD
jgi:hypothetical protein